MPAMPKFIPKPKLSDFDEGSEENQASDEEDNDEGEGEMGSDSD